MNVNPNPLASLLSYQLGKLGSLTARKFLQEIDPYGLKPKHVGILAVLQSKGSVTQQELATELGIAPSLVVMLSDDLEAMHAIKRVRDSKDRRRQNLTLLPHGQELLTQCVKIARAIDQELTNNLTNDQTQLLKELLMSVSLKQDD